MTTIKPPPPQATYKRGSPETWGAVRAAYEAGTPAQRLAERHGVTVDSIRRHAWLEGWTKQHPKRPYKIRGKETWAVIRESYLAGAPARVLAARYDVTERNIWRRAWKEGWTKRDRVEPAPAPALTPLIDPDGSTDPTDFVALQGECVTASIRAMREGRLEEAARLARLAESYGRMWERAGR